MAANLLPVLFGLATGTQDWTKLWSGVIDSCGDIACVRGRVDLALDRALNMTSIPLSDGVTLVQGNYSADLGLARQEERQDILSKFIHLVTTRNINIELQNANGNNDGRGKKKKYLEYIYAAMLVAAVILPLKLQALALVAGKALLIAKVALALAGSALLKKLSQHDDHHRRVDVPADPYLLAYRDHR